MLLAYHGATHPLRQRRESKAEGSPDTGTAGVGEPFTAFDCTSKQTTFQVSQDRWSVQIGSFLTLMNISCLNVLWMAHGHFITSAGQGTSKERFPGCVKLSEKVAFCLPTAGRRTQFFHPIFTQRGKVILV